MSPRISGLLRPALRTTLNTTVAAGLAGAVVLAGTTSGDPSASGPRHETRPTTAAIAAAAAVTTTVTPRHHRHRHHGFTGDWRARVLRVASAQAGDRYAYGAAGPNAFDCSGFTSYAYRLATGKRLPHSSSAQQGSTRRVSAAAARPGDLVFFHSGGHVYHVAIYVGHHTIIHAPYPGQRVKRERIWTSAVTYGRVV
ncbi:cell wall-associated NlpC family hydrolase [Marmoricola sp. URHA0025 HA25]